MEFKTGSVQFFCPAMPTKVFLFTTVIAVELSEITRNVIVIFSPPEPTKAPIFRGRFPLIIVSDSSLILNPDSAIADNAAAFTSARLAAKTISESLTSLAEAVVVALAVVSGAVVVVDAHALSMSAAPATIVRFLIVIVPSYLSPPSGDKLMLWGEPKRVNLPMHCYKFLPRPAIMLPSFFDLKAIATVRFCTHKPRSQPRKTPP